MRILLVGEYSRLHNSLKEGLQKLGHTVCILGLNDGFKNYNVDLFIERKKPKGIYSLLNKLTNKLFTIDLVSYSTYKKFEEFEKEAKNHDVVQLINENSFLIHPFYEKRIIRFLSENNQNLFLLSCSFDYKQTIHYQKNSNLKSAFVPYNKSKINKSEFQSVLKFLRPEYKKLHQFIYSKAKGVIASDLDYLLAYKNDPKFKGVIPNPINVDKLEYIFPNLSNKIILFHGINSANYFKKGNDYFNKALDIINQKYNDKVKIITTTDLPYSKYIENYNQAHILLDQVYAYDQGYNALEAMAKGKVVFTGAEKEFMEHYQLTERVCVNALPNVDYLVDELSFLIENPDEIVAMSKRARAFIEKEHHYVTIAQKYVDVWTKN